MEFEVLIPKYAKRILHINGKVLATAELEDFDIESEYNEVRTHFKGVYQKDYLILDGSFKSQNNATFNINTIGPSITILFVVKSDEEVFHETAGKPLGMQTGVVHVFFRKQTEHFLELKNQNGVRCFSVIITLEMFKTLFEKEVWLSHIFLKKIANSIDVHFGEISFANNPNLTKIFMELFSNKIPKHFRAHYITLKIQELFLLTFCEIEEHHRLSNKLSNAEHRKIMQAKAYLTMNYVSLPAIKELSRIILLNEFKLKTGFKKLYGITIYNYIIELRMNNAKKMLRERKLSVKDISNSLGYNSVSHFIQKFKSFYTLTPKQFIDSKFDF